MCPECVRVFLTWTRLNGLIYRDFRKHSDVLEPSTPSLPCDPNGDRRQPVATVYRTVKPFSGARRSEPLPPVAPPLFHTCSIPWAQKRALWLGQRPQVEVDPFCIERGQPTTTSPVGAHGSRWRRLITAMNPWECSLRAVLRLPAASIHAAAWLSARFQWCPSMGCGR